MTTKSGPVAQLGARFHGMEEVVGSIPTRSTKIFSAKLNYLGPAPLKCAKAVGAQRFILSLVGSSLRQRSKAQPEPRLAVFIEGY